jgi:hypothetical protein
MHQATHSGRVTQFQKNPGMLAAREAARRFRESPGVLAAEEIHDSPEMQAIRELQDSPTMRAAREAALEAEITSTAFGRAAWSRRATACNHSLSCSEREL